MNDSLILITIISLEYLTLFQPRLSSITNVALGRPIILQYLHQIKLYVYNFTFLLFKRQKAKIQFKQLRLQIMVV